jgi:hypothetical protein
VVAHAADSNESEAVTSSVRGSILAVLQTGVRRKNQTAGATPASGDETAVWQIKAR